MQPLTLRRQLIVPVVIVAAALIGVFTLVTYGASLDDVIFPIPELGNCGSKEECHAYCESPDNILECVAFAEEHGLMSREEAARARRFADVAREGGPGSCRGKAECEAYCENVEHMDECLDFAEEHDVIPPDELEEARKVQRALRSGAQLPGGCTSKRACETYCTGVAHIEECIAFAETAGFMTPKEIEEVRRVLPLMQRGETPGGCTSKEQCDAYCNNPDHFEECIAFAEKAGFISPDDAAMARKTGGRGPGDCRGREECKAFCNDPANQEECFTFAQEHGLLSKEDLARAREGFSRLREGLRDAPPEVHHCLQENLGINIIAKIESGELAPGPEIGNVVRECFERSAPELAQKVQEGLAQAPPEVRECITSQVGDEVLGSIERGELPPPEIGEVIRGCFSEHQAQFQEEALRRVHEGLTQFSPEARQCVVDALGEDLVVQIEQGEAPEITPEIGDVMQECAARLFGGPDGAGEGSFSPDGGGIDVILNRVPPEVRACVREKLGDDFSLKGIADPRAEIEEAARGCFGGRGSVPEPPHDGDVSGEYGEETFPPPEGAAPGGFSGAFSAPSPGSAECIAELYGADFADRLGRGEEPVPPDLQEKVAGCIQRKIFEQVQGTVIPPGGTLPIEGMPPGGSFRTPPPGEEFHKEQPEAGRYQPLVANLLEIVRGMLRVR